MRPIQPRSRRSPAGFTIIELMIVVVVVAVLLAVAVPSFLDSMRKGRRSEAFTALSAMQQAQERYRSNNASYASTLAALSVTTPTAPGAYYALSVGPNAPTATSYEVTADGSGSSQSNDAQCAKLSVKANAGTIQYASCKACASFTYADSDPCWSR